MHGARESVLILALRFHHTPKFTLPSQGLACKRIVLGKLPKLQPYEKSCRYSKLEELSSYSLGYTCCTFELCTKCDRFLVFIERPLPLGPCFEYAMGDAFGVAGSAVGVISLGIQVCQGLLTYYESWKGCHQDIANTSKSIASLTETLELVSRVIRNRKGQGEPVEQQISSIVVRCLTGIEALSKELEGFKQYPESADIRSKIKSHMRRLYYPFKESTLAKLRDSVQDVRDDLVPALAILQVEQLTGLEEGTKNVTISLASMQKGRFYQGSFSIVYTYFLLWRHCSND